MALGVMLELGLAKSRVLGLVVVMLGTCVVVLRNVLVLVLGTLVMTMLGSLGVGLDVAVLRLCSVVVMCLGLMLGRRDIRTSPILLPLCRVFWSVRFWQARGVGM